MVRCFEHQSYPERELVVVFERLDEASQRLLATTPNVVLVQAPTSAKLPLGALRNLSLQAARGPYVCQWDDDDWHAPRRIEIQLEALTRAGVKGCLLSRWLVLDEVADRAYISGKRLWEGSLLCRQELLVGGFPEQARDEDRPVIEQLQRRERLASVDRPELYVYTYHGKNTWDAQHFGRVFAAGVELALEDTARLNSVLRS